MSTIGRRSGNIRQFLVTASRDHKRVTSWFDYGTRAEAERMMKNWMDKGFSVHIIDLDATMLEQSEQHVKWEVCECEELMKEETVLGIVNAIDEKDALRLADLKYDPDSERDLWVRQIPTPT